MATLGKAYVQIIPSAEGISGSISQALGGESDKAGKASGLKIGAGIKKGVLVAGTAAGAALAGTVAASLSEGGKLEQSFGGLDTLYGDASSAAKEYALNAAQAGISANSYAEQAVSFGASLKAAFGGDTAKAAEAANTAIMDMADNAAKMGTPIESIQQAYQGFAKQNYTMLDNLKLGYGGTKTEMERLLADAQEISGVEYNIDNLGDVYSAISVIQGELGLTGVAANEAATTFSGSFGAMKASAANLAGALSTGEGVEEALTNLGTSASNFLFNNLLPMLGRIATNIPTVLTAAMNTALPIIQQKGPELITKLVTGIQTALPIVLAKGREILTNIGTGITNALPTILSKGTEIISNVINGIGSALPGLASSAAEIITSIAGWIGDNLPTIGEKGGEMLKTLASTIISNIPNVLAAAAKIVVAVAKALVKLAPAAIKAAGQLVAGLRSGIASGLGSIKAAAGKVVTGIATKLKPVTDKAKSIMNTMKNAIVSVWNSIKTKATSVWNNIKNAMTKPIETAKNTISNVINTVKGLFPVNLGHIFNLQIPHVSVSGGSAPWGIGGQGTPPSFGVTWAKKGMILDGATLIGAGEAGREGIIPLEGRYMRPFAQAIAGEMNGGQTVNFNVTVNGAENPEQFANRMVREMQLRMRAV